MMSHKSSAVWVKPALMMLAVVVALVMLRLGVWQLNRAEQKQIILDSKRDAAQLETRDINELSVDTIASDYERQRFRPVSAVGQFVPQSVIYHDSQVLESVVGYDVYAVLATSKHNVLVKLGWVPAGTSRSTQPEVTLPTEPVVLQGRLNTFAKQPPLWNDKYDAASGVVWQFLPMPKLSQYFDLAILPMVIELPSDHDVTRYGPNLVARQWQGIDDKWVGKHKAYAFQWFSMAVVFLIACCVVAFRPSKASTK